MDSQFFSRSATWQFMQDRLVVIDSFSSKAPRMITMEEWHETVFLAADGRHTVRELIEQIGKHFPDGPPDGLGDHILSVIEALIAEEILRLHDAPEDLPPYFEEEFSTQSPEIRKAQMEADGLLSGE